MKKLITLIFLLQLNLQLVAQKEANNWALGNYQLDFNGGQPAVGFEYADYLNRGIGLISDANGDLLFYSDGFSVWNKNHQLMPNGTELIPSHRNTSTQESLVIPDPSNNQMYYLFTVDPWNGQETSGLYYSIIDLTLEGGLGDVTIKGDKLLDNTTNKISARLHDNLVEYWIVVHEHNTNNYYSFLVSSEGISDTPIINQIGKVHGFWDGQMKFSPDGKKIACSREYNYSDNTALDLFDFDPNTGRLSNEISLILPADRSSEGLDFSSDAKKLYVAQSGSTGESGLYQFDLDLNTEEEIQMSRVLLHRETFNGFRQLQLGPDGNIYITKGGGGGGTAHLGVISNTNEDAENVIVEENGLFLGGGSSFVNYTPNFIQNYFFKTSFLHEENCQSFPTFFRVTNTHLLESTHWDFGDGSTSTETDPQHLFNDPGTYTVTLTANYADHSDVITREVTINPIPILELGDDIQVCFGSKLSVEDLYTSYYWNTGDTTFTTRVNASGYYVLEVMNEFGCTSKDSLYVDIIDLPEINLPDTILMETESVEINPGNFSSYSWSTGQSTQLVSISQLGWYSIVVTNDFGCESHKSFYVGDGSESKPESDRWIRLNPKPTSLTGNDIAFVDEFTGFIVNREQLLITRDQGASWEELLDIDNGFRIAFSDGYGFIIGERGSIYKSTYKGGGWNKLETNLDDILNSITLLSKDSILITSDRRLYKSFDGGITWQELEIPNVDVEDSYFVNENVGHVACRNGTILKTTDGGATWYATETSNVIPSDFFKITFVNESVGYATQEHSEVYKTIDGGETWDEIASLDAGYALQFLDENRGIIAGQDGATHKTEDGGETWTWIGFDGRRSGSSLFGIYFINDRVGFATGLRGRVIRTFDGGNSWESYSTTYNTISDIEIEADETVYALVSNNILKSTDQGLEWENLGSVLPGEKTRKIDFVNSEIGFAIGGGSQSSSASSVLILKTSDGGVTWSRQNTELLGFGAPNLEAMVFIDENIGFVSTSQNSIYKTVDSGITWNQVNSPANRIREFQFLDANTGFAINAGNYYGRLYKTVDGGQNWEMIYEDEGDRIYSLHFINTEVGFLIGDPDLDLRKTTDGGSTWEVIEIPYEWYNDVFFYTENFGFICDEEGRVFETLDGGKSWERLFELSGVTQISTQQQEIYAYGNNGNIFRSNITLNDQLRFSSVNVFNVRNTKAAINGQILSSIDDLTLTIELNKLDSDIEEIEYATLNAGIEQLNLSLPNLEENSTYKFRFKATSGDEIAYSEEISFKTLSFDQMATISGFVISEHSDKTASIIFNVKSLFDSADVFIDIGRASGDVEREELVGSWTAEFTRKLNHTIDLLEPDSEYFIRVRIKNGDRSIKSDELSFFTNVLNVGTMDDLLIYPNPSSRYLKIEGFDGLSETVILNSEGVVV